MLCHIDDSVKTWQRPGLRRRLVFALLGVLIALSYALLLAGEEAQAKGGKESPNRGSAEGAAEGRVEPAPEAAGEANRLAGNEEAGGKEAGGKEAGSVAVRDPAPRADRPSPVDDGPAREADTLTKIDRAADKAAQATKPVSETGRTFVERTAPLGEATEPARDAVRPAVEPVLNETAPVTGLALAGTTRLPEAEPVLEGATSVVEPVLEKTGRTEIAPVLEETTSAVEPILEGTNTPVEPPLAETLPVVEPVLNGTIPAAVEPVGEAVEPVARPFGEEANPAAGPVAEEAASPVGPALKEASFPAVEPAIGAATSPFEPVPEAVAPVAGSGSGEGIVRRDAEPPMLEGEANTIPASPSLALAAEARVALPDHYPAPATPESGRDSSPGPHGPIHDATQASTLKLPGGYSGLSEGSAAVGANHAALPGLTAAKDARDRAPRPVPLGFPPGVPPVGVSFVGSGAAGVALDLLAILALLPVLSRVGGLSWSTREAFKRGPYPRLAIERPG